MSINTQPLGAPGELPFSGLDLLNIAREFNSTQGTPYIANSTGTVACTDSVLNPAIQWCATKAPADNPWATMPGLPFVHHVLVPPPSPPTPPYVTPPVLVTPEPTYVGALLIAVVIMCVGGYIFRRIGRRNKEMPRLFQRQARTMQWVVLGY